MSKKITTSRARLDELNEFIQINRGVAKKAAELSRDRRTISSTKTAEKELSGRYKAKEIAQNLGISTQKWVSIRKQIRTDKLYSPEIRDLLRVNYKEKREIEREIKRSYKEEKPYKYRVEVEDSDGNVSYKKVWVYPNMDGLKDQVGWAQETKLLPDLEQAAAWWSTISGGSDYFVIAKAPGGGYWVMDIRTPEEKSSGNKGQLDGVTQARKILERYNDDY